jgi:L-cystine uptake protein TcyP (sodium:dicarboxylate symporter family)
VHRTLKLICRTVSKAAVHEQRAPTLPLNVVDLVQENPWISLVGSNLGSAGSVVIVTMDELRDHTPIDESTPATQVS